MAGNTKGSKTQWNKHNGIHKVDQNQTGNNHNKAKQENYQFKWTQPTEHRVMTQSVSSSVCISQNVRPLHSLILIYHGRASTGWLWTLRGNFTPFRPCLFVTLCDRVGGGGFVLAYPEVQVMLAEFQDVHQHKRSLITLLISFQHLVITWQNTDKILRLQRGYWDRPASKRSALWSKSPSRSDTYALTFVSVSVSCFV